MSNSNFFKLRILTLISLLVITPVGFYSKYYAGPYNEWINNSLGGLFYEIFWCLLILLVFPGLRPWGIALSVFVITCLLEFLQLCDSKLLNYLRSFFIGRTILGNTFNWTDFIYYFAGSNLAYLWMILLKKRIWYFGS